jgi:hypothetical protein
MYPNFNDNAFQTTLDSLNDSSTLTIDYISQEIKLRKDSVKLNKIKKQNN